MNIKIQGGGSGEYANTGSCTAVTSYLQHEDARRMIGGQQIEPFFTRDRNVRAREVTYTIDNNKAKLCRDDAKFYMITVSPSEKEIQAMGKDPEARSRAFKEFINREVIPKYAEGFNVEGVKEVTGSDVVYFGKIHHTRDDKPGEQMHAHIIVSRKDLSNSIKLTPTTTLTGKKKTGTAKRSFHRSEFFHKAEQAFDRHFGYKRDFSETFEYQNALKNGTPEEIKQVAMKAVSMEKKAATKVLDKNRELAQSKAKTVERGRGLSV